MAELQPRPRFTLPRLEAVQAKAAQLRADLEQCNRLLFVLCAPNASPTNANTVIPPFTPPAGAPKPTHVLGVIPPRALSQDEVERLNAAMATGEVAVICSALESLKCSLAVLPIGGA